MRPENVVDSNGSVKDVTPMDLGGQVDERIVEEGI